MQIDRFAIFGGAALDAQLAELGAAAATELGSAATKAAAEELQQAWIKGAPFDPRPKPKSWTLSSGEVRRRDYGHLNQNIRVKKVRVQKETRVAWKVTTGDGFWGYFQELGTVKMAAHPWARPINERMKSRLVAVEIDVLQNGINRVISQADIRAAGGGSASRRQYGAVLPNGRNG